jgi:predicted nucleotidyltransferase
MNSDFKELLKNFAEKKVRYLIVGGYAVAKHAEPRFTKDLDIWISNSLDNAKLVYKALEKFGAPLNKITIEDLTTPDLVFQIGIEPSRIDILMGVEALAFDDCWERRSSVTIDGIEIHFISLDDLIINKNAVARPQDLIDVKNLELKKTSRSTGETVLPEQDD